MCAVGSYLNGSTCYLCSSQEDDCANCQFSQNTTQNTTNFTCNGCSEGLVWNG